jgi:hypothetical protein
MSKVAKRNTEFLDLPEDVFLAIFKYLDYQTIYLTVGYLCQRTKKIVDDHVQVGGLFYITGLKDIGSHVLHVLKRHKAIVSILSQSLLQRPCLMINGNENSPGTFEFAFGNKIVFSMLFEKITDGVVEYGVEYVLHEYEPRKSNRLTFLERQIYKLDSIRMVNKIICCCKLGKLKVLLLVKRHYGVNIVMAYGLLILDFEILCTRRGRISSHLLDFPHPLMEIRGVSLIRVSEDKIILIGNIVDS